MLDEIIKKCPRYALISRLKKERNSGIEIIRKRRQKTTDSRKQEEIQTLIYKQLSVPHKIYRLIVK